MAGMGMKALRGFQVRRWPSSTIGRYMCANVASLSSGSTLRIALAMTYQWVQCVMVRVRQGVRRVAGGVRWCTVVWGRSQVCRYIITCRVR